MYDTDSVSSVVFKVIERYRKVLQISRALITGYGGSLLFHLGYLVRATEITGG